METREFCPARTQREKRDRLYIVIFSLVDDEAEEGVSSEYEEEGPRKSKRKSKKGKNLPFNVEEEIVSDQEQEEEAPAVQASGLPLDDDYDMFPPSMFV